ncbi:MAG: mechanosensitive ion channel, partial [Acidobacteria bacterium]|nr:mechanosensitive ion channel [Acidobacteriota bacterium]
AALPLVFVFAAMSSQQEQAWQHALGRLALVVLAIASAVFLSRVLHPAHGVSAELLAANRGDWLERLRNVWYGVAVLAPLGLAGVALAGYMYAAADLTAKSLETLWLATAAIVAYGMVSRWVLVSRRTLAFRQRRERAQAEEGEVVEPAPDLSQIDAQTRRLIRTLSTAAALGGVWLVWSDMVPALSVLDRVVLWPLDAEPGTEGAFTLEHLGLTLLLAVLTAALARNVPALLEMLLLQLPIQPGSRYALTSMSRYAVVFSGALAIFGVLGVTWSSVQWLVAAIGVGLGFGLQEIFANFVSGLLLLMERPVRVGDTITVGGVTGTVTRIRIRATTIQDWDLKELVVPNKDLVTGHLLNWTLSDAANRVTVFVGVAYGSDVERVTRVLQEIVAATALVLESPEPQVTFEEFGDSALKFSIRAYVREVEDRLPAIHALHTAIAKRFGEEEIEIAFPQMDIHVRSTAPHLRDDPPRPLRLASPSG